MAEVTFIEQDAPVEEYGRALYAVARSIFRALIDSLTEEDLTDLNSPIDRITLRQLAKVVRLDRDKGMRGDGFEWAVHEAVVGNEPLVSNPLVEVATRASKFVSGQQPTSILFGHERAKYLGFLDAVIGEAGNDSYILPEGSGRPYRFGPWIRVAAEGQRAEARLSERIKQIWKTDLFISLSGSEKYLAATVKSNAQLLEGGRGLRIGIVPESSKIRRSSTVIYDNSRKLWIVTLPDPNGFMGLFNDAYMAVGRAICTVGKQTQPPYYTKPSAKAQILQEQIEKYPTSLVSDIEEALNEAAQQHLVSAKTQLVGVNAPDWLHIKKLQPKIIAPRPSFVKLD